MTDTTGILAANADFYKAFATADVAGMARIWAEDDGISCIHPGWPAIVGRQAVLASWRDILLSPGAPQIACHEPSAIIADDDGRVLCVEIIGSGALAASNHFRLLNGLWRLVHHQASPIAMVPAQRPEDRPPPGGRVH